MLQAFSAWAGELPEVKRELVGACKDVRRASQKDLRRGASA